jgi:hypothetical protein
VLDHAKRALLDRVGDLAGALEAVDGEAQTVAGGRIGWRTSPYPVIVERSSRKLLPRTRPSTSATTE